MGRVDIFQHGVFEPYERFATSLVIDILVPGGKSFDWPNGSQQVFNSRAGVTQRLFYACSFFGTLPRECVSASILEGGTGRTTPQIQTEFRGIRTIPRILHQAPRLPQ